MNADDSRYMFCVCLCVSCVSCVCRVCLANRKAIVAAKGVEAIVAGIKVHHAYLTIIGPCAWHLA